MSDVIVSTNDPITTVTTTDNLVEIAITNNPVEVSASTAGVQGASYNQGDPIYVTVRNATGATLPKGTIVYISGANGNHVQVTPAIATSDATSARTLGWLAEAIANNASGLCQIEGYLEGLNTQGLTAGNQLYLSGTTAGAFTATKPQAPIHLVYVGVVTKVSAGDGHVFVKVQNGYELEELHDVQIVSPVNNQVLTYDSATDLWKNATNPADGVTSITATAPLTGGTITSTGSIGLDQTALSITQSQVSNLVSDLAGKANLAGGNAFTGAQTITSTASGEFPLSIISASGQTASTFRVRNSANTGDLFSVDSSGNLRSPALINITTFNNSRLQMQSTGVLVDTQIATNLPLAVRGASGQTENMQVWQNSAGSNLARISQNGSIGTNANLSVGNTGITNTNQFQVTATAATQIGAVIRAAASQSSDIQQWQNSAGSVLGRIKFDGTPTFSYMTHFGTQTLNADADTVVPLAVKPFSATQTADLVQYRNSSNSTIAAVTAAGFNLTPGLRAVDNTGAFINMQSGTNGVLVSTRAAANLGLVVRASASQTANLQSWQDSSGNQLTVIDNSGFIKVGDSATGGQVAVTATAAGNRPLVLKGAASQSANLTEWQNSAGSNLLWVNSAGNLNSGTFIIGTQNSGAQFTMVRATAAATNPGANLARLYFRDGTNAGTLKLVVRAGAAGAETTILDNIPT